MDPQRDRQPSAPGSSDITARQWLLGLGFVGLVSVAVVAGGIWLAFTFLFQGCGTGPSCQATNRSTPAVSSVPQPSERPLPEGVPGGILCGRHDPARCAATIDVVRQVHPEAVATAWAIVVDDVCDPRAICDRLYPFDSIVVLVPEPGRPGAPVSFQVVGLGDWPERIEGNAGPLPAHILAMIDSLS